MDKKIILGIQVQKKEGLGTRLQSILSTYGCVIRTRLGLNEPEGDYASGQGIIILELDGDEKECKSLEKELLHLEQVTVKKMVFPSKP